MASDMDRLPCILHCIPHRASRSVGLPLYTPSGLLHRPTSICEPCERCFIVTGMDSRPEFSTKRLRFSAPKSGPLLEQKQTPKKCPPIVGGYRLRPPFRIQRWPLFWVRPLGGPQMGSMSRSCWGVSFGASVSDPKMVPALGPPLGRPPKRVCVSVTALEDPAWCGVDNDGCVCA